MVKNVVLKPIRVNLVIVIALIITLVIPALIPPVKAQEEEKYFFEINAMDLTNKPNVDRVYAVLEPEFKKIGIKLTYTTFEGSVFNQHLFKGAIEGATMDEEGYDLMLAGYGLGGSRDPCGFSGCIGSAGRYPSSWNCWRMADVDLDQAMEDAESVTDRAERQKHYNKVQEIMCDVLPVIPIVWPKRPWVLQADLEGFDPNVGWGLHGAWAWYWKGQTGGTVKYACNTDPVKLLPYWGNIGYDIFCSEIWESIVDVDGDQKVVPELAKSWEISDDGITYTFHLYENVTWHDGVPFTSEDLVFSYDVLLDKETATTAHSIFAGNVASYEAPDKYTFVVHLKSQNAGALAELFGAYYMMPKHILEDVPHSEFKNHDIANKHPIGTGPFKFVEWVPKQYLKMEANDDYYRGRPKLDYKIGVNIPDAATAVAALMKGEVDLLSQRYEISELLDSIIEDPNLKYSMAISYSSIMLGVNMGHPILNNQYVRKAISAVIPREEICEEIWLGRAIPAQSFLNERFWCYNSSISMPMYDIEQAKRYMEMAGYDFEWLELAPATPLSEKLLYAVVGLVVGVAIGVATRYLRR